MPEQHALLVRPALPLLGALMIEFEDTEDCDHEWETDDVWNIHTKMWSTQTWCSYCYADRDE